METFLGEIILESLADASVLSTYEAYLVKQRVADMPGEPMPVWHINRYRFPREKVTEIASKLTEGLSRGEWYVHFFSEQGNELYVVMKHRVFLLPKIKDQSWEPMMRYGESVGVGRRWTSSIPIQLPD